MQSDNKFLDDLTKVASGAVGTVFSVKQEADAMFKQNVEKFFSNSTYITREEFEVVKEMISKARSEQKNLDKRLLAIEKQLGTKNKISTKKAKRPVAKKKTK